MTLLKVALLHLSLIISGVELLDYHATVYLKPLDDISGIAEFSNAAVDRGPRWYDYNTSKSSTVSQLDESSSLSLNSGTGSTSIAKSSGVSSKTTAEKRLAKRVYRECTICPADMIKRHTNIGIKWICGMYQRARRSFKSDCMMRYRNCQDGTMFVKISDDRCHPDPKLHSGRHWFYVYRV